MLDVGVLNFNLKQVFLRNADGFEKDILFKIEIGKTTRENSISPMRSRTV